MPRITPAPPPDHPELAHITPALRPMAVRVDELTPDPQNVRVHRSINVNAVKASLKRFGQRLPLIVQEDGLIVHVGNCRLQAAKELGWKWVAAIVTNDAEAVARAFAVADNRTAELATWDDEALAGALDAIQDDEGLLASIGFTQRQIDRLLARFTELEFEVGGDAPSSSALVLPAPAEASVAPPASADVRYVQLLFVEADYDEFQDIAGRLAERYGTDGDDGVHATVLRALEEVTANA